MTNTEAILLSISVFSILFGWLKARQARQKATTHADILRDDANEIMVYRDIIRERQIRYLGDCFVAGKVLPHPKSWLTDEEIRLHQRLLEHREELMELNKSQVIGG